MASILALSSIPGCKNKKIDVFTLEKRKGEDFRILQLTDVQIIDPSQQPYEGRLSQAEAEAWQDRDLCAFNLIRELVGDTNPDYIVLTGDNVYGQFDADGSNFIALVKLLESFRIPWSFVNGNHDGEYFVASGKGGSILCGKGMKWQADYVKNNTKYCLYDPGDESMGYGNYSVLIEEKGNPVFSLSMLDTHGCNGYEGPGINSKQTEWFEMQIKKINEYAGRTVPNLIFLHIPLKQYSLAAKTLGSDDGVGVFSDNGNFGENGEKVSCFESDVFWNKIKELSSTVGIFAGHDHVNSSSLVYEGIRLTYGVKTGTYDYHSTQGGTLISISSEGGFTVKHVCKN